MTTPSNNSSNTQQQRKRPPSGPAMYGTVVRVEPLGASMLRVVLGGPGLDSFESSGHTDEYVNALFIPDGAPYTAPFDVDAARALDPAVHPRGRRYTVRSWNAAERLLTVDFVNHGDAGLASKWARHAQPGDTLQMIGPSGNYQPNPDADWYLLVGDESALPAIGATLDALPAEAHSVVAVVVDGPDCEFELTSAGSLEVHWLHRCTSPTPEVLLADAVAELDWRPGTVDVFVHGEANEVRATRRHLIDERGIDRSQASISPYWRRDHTDEAWRAVKRQWMAEQDTATA